MSSSIGTHTYEPLFTVLMAVYNVEQYIKGTFTSFQQQSFPFSDLELIIVDDGSTDSSGEIARRFATKHPNVSYIRQDNGGPGAARAEALKHATGEWVTVVDPDDIIDKDYFSAVRNFIKRDVNHVADLLITNIVVMNGSSAALSDTHPLNFRFKNGDQLVSLNDEPNSIQLGATAFLKRSILLENGLSYDSRIEPTFEDAHLLGRYLSCTDDAVVGVVSEAKYYYRKRADQSSLVQSGWDSQGRYTSVLEHGYLDLLRTVKSNLGYVPTWTQNLVLYDLMWYFKEDSKMNGKTSSLDYETKPIFLHLLNKIFVYIEPKTIHEFALHGTWWSLSQAILARYKGIYDYSPMAFQWGKNTEKGGNRYSIVTTSKNKNIDVYLNGTIANSTKFNYINHYYFGAYFFTEINIEIKDAGHVRLMHDGTKVQVQRATKRKPLSIPKQSARFELLQDSSANKRVIPPALEKVLRKTPINVSRIQRTYTKFSNVQTRVWAESVAMEKTRARTVVDALRRKRASREQEITVGQDLVSSKQLLNKSTTPSIRSKYRNSWVILDRPLKADDNGEHFYRYVQQTHPEINAWFLLDQDSSDWGRLQNEGFRLIDINSDEAFYVCHHAEFIISSDAVQQVMYPAGRGVIDYTAKKFIFLQHGVIKDDLSRWLNGKEISAIVTSTQAEYESFVNEDSPYQLSHDEVILTGLARYDSLLHLSIKNSQEFIIVMPTWRMGLRDKLAGLEGDELVEEFRRSEFARNWMSYINSDELKSVSETSGRKVLFLPHPAMSDLVQCFDLPEYVLSFEDLEMTFQDALSRASLFITDYSSVAFDAAYINIPVIYFQFDQHSFFAGHSYSKGYFDYERDGFGPVTVTLRETLNATHALLTSTMSGEIYQSRREATFPKRDGKNCERTFNAITLLN